MYLYLTPLLSFFVGWRQTVLYTKFCEYFIRTFLSWVYFIDHLSMDEKKNKLTEKEVIIRAPGFNNKQTKKQNITSFHHYQILCSEMHSYDYSIINLLSC